MSQIILRFHFWHAVHPHPLRGLPSGPTLGASAFGSAGLASCRWLDWGSYCGSFCGCRLRSSRLRGRSRGWSSCGYLFVCFSGSILNFFCSVFLNLFELLVGFIIDFLKLNFLSLGNLGFCFLSLCLGLLLLSL